MKKCDLSVIFRNNDDETEIIEIDLEELSLYLIF